MYICVIVTSREHHYYCVRVWVHACVRILDTETRIYYCGSCLEEVQWLLCSLSISLALNISQHATSQNPKESWDFAKAGSLAWFSRLLSFFFFFF